MPEQREAMLCYLRECIRLTADLGALQRAGIDFVHDQTELALGYMRQLRARSGRGSPSGAP